MPENNFSFVLMWDSNYFHTLSYSIKQIHKFYPNAKIYFYDWGLDYEQAAILDSDEQIVRIVREKKYVDIHINFASRRQRIKLLYGIHNIKSLLYQLIYKTYSLLSHKNVFSFLKKEIILANKVLCFKDFACTYWEDFVFLDWDAFLIHTLSSLNKYTFDIWVTSRREKELSSSFWNCQLINSWVLFFFWGKEKNTKFIELWEQQMRNTCEHLVEQTSLSRLIEKTNPGIFNQYYKTCDVYSWKHNIKVIILPCEEYNYNWINDTFVPTPNISILHFKWWRHTKIVFDTLIQRIDPYL